ncbi:MAG: LacI family DNA-binding transcriptional regulator [Ardenticatenaceae bacterium]|nr:LacI family DNA-binding transcriptional regulator [Anaerolineales bacterium]MCB9007369.1 LacI family DNA-binding transcriptional regulator [Ardenticatenaceae bacterium]
MHKLTLETIAELAGVSRSTVSRVVNDHAGVSEAVRNRVLAVIEHTGYQPNSIARSLATRRTGVIGLVVPRQMQTLFVDPYFPRLIQGVSAASNQQGSTLALFLLHTEDEERQIYQQLLNRSMLDGVLFVTNSTEDPFVQRLLNSGIPFVTIGRDCAETPTHFVDVENAEGAHTAVSHLIRLGYERIATITGPLAALCAQNRLDGYRQALVGRGLGLDANFIVEGDFTEAGGYFAMQQLMPHEPDAVFVASDAMALGAMRAAREAGWVIPDDIALVSFDDLPQAALSAPTLTTIRQPIKRLGMLAVETLLDVIANGSTPTRRIVLPTELIIRSSCGADPFL